MDDRHAKKRRLAALIGLKGVTCEALAAILKQVRDDPIEPVSAWCMNKFFQDEFAKVKLDLQLPMGSRKVFTWSVCSVPKLVEYFAAHSRSFRVVMDRATRTPEPLQGILYLDEVTPGNVLKPDNHRKFWAIYLGFRQVEANMLYREEMWLPVAMLRTTIAHKVGVSYCVRQLLRSMLLEPTRLASTGCAIQLSSPTLLRLAISNILADEAALKSTWCNKGAGGHRCCFFCRNVVSLHADLTSGQDYIVDVSCSKPDRFDRASDSDIWAAFDRLAREKNVLGQGRFEALEKAVGITYDDTCLLADQELRRHVKPTSSLMDWMHNFLVHGICSMEIHAFMACIKAKLGLSFVDLGTFASAAWLWPGSQDTHKIHDIFTPSRERSCSHSFKASASELLMLFPILRYFAFTIVAPTKKCDKEVKSLVSLCDVMDGFLAFKRGANVRGISDHIGVFFEAHKSAYGLKHIKPKHHFVWHNGMQLEEGFNLDCWVHERKHQSLKRAANDVKNTSTFEQSVLARVVLDQSRQLQRLELGEGLSGKSVADVSLARSIGALSAEVAKGMTLRNLSVKVNDVVLFADHAGIVRSCIKTDDKLLFAIELLRQSKPDHIHKPYVTTFNTCYSTVIAMHIWFSHIVHVDFMHFGRKLNMNCNNRRITYVECRHMWFVGGLWFWLRRQSLAGSHSVWKLVPGLSILDVRDWDFSAPYCWSWREDRDLLLLHRRI